MKIGILTYHRAHNYGALLQCYSLKKAIEKKGHSVEVIDYWPDYHSSTYHYIPHFKNLSFSRKIKAVIKISLSSFRLIKRTHLYKQFILKKLDVPKKVQYPTNIKLKELFFDTIIYGSDQIWRRTNLPDFKGFDYTYWGDYFNSSIKKITYAASMGTIDINETETHILTNKLKNFTNISVREEALKTVFEKGVGYDVPIVLDPVFLTEKMDWDKLILSEKRPSKLNKKYIFFYQLIQSKSAVEFCNKLKQEKGFDVIEIQARVNPFAFGKRYFQTAGPIDFINLIKNAEYVVTTSFHGLAFSLIYQKQFFVLGMGNNSERALSLLRKLNLENRYMVNESDYDFGGTKDIDYAAVNDRLNQLRVKSNEFLDIELKHISNSFKNFTTSLNPKSLN